MHEIRLAPKDKLTRRSVLGGSVVARDVDAAHIRAYLTPHVVFWADTLKPTTTRILVLAILHLACFYQHVGGVSCDFVIIVRRPYACCFRMAELLY